MDIIIKIINFANKFINNSSKMIKKIVYLLFWSLGLLWATFPDLFTGEMDFNFKQMEGAVFFQKYMFPLLMVLLLYMFDVIYAFHLESADGEPTKALPVYIFTAGFLLCFILSVAFSGTVFALLLFVLSWLCLIGMKYFKTNEQSRPTPAEVTEIAEN